MEKLTYQILKIESVIDRENDLTSLVLTLANVKERVLLRLIDFPDFAFIELGETLSPRRPIPWSKYDVKTMMEKIDPEYPRSLWSFAYREKYCRYSTKKYPFLTLFSFKFQDFDEKINEIKTYFAKQLQKSNPKMKEKEALKMIDLKVYSRNFTPVQKFSAVTGINPGHWITFEDLEFDDSLNYWSHLPIHHASVNSVKKIDAPSADFHPCLSVVCLDFEVNSSRRGKFPDPWQNLDLIYLSSVVKTILGTKEPKEGFLITAVKVPFKNIINKKGDNPSPVLQFDDEIEALRRLEELFLKLDPDVIVTYNGSGFDFPYWKSRYDRDGQELGFFGRITIKNPIFKKIDWASSAHKAREKQILVVPGVITVDLYEIVRRDYFHPLYTLKYISEQILGDDEAKDELSAEEQFRIFKEGTKEEWYRLLHYSLRDSFAPLDIISKLSTMNNLMAMARIIGINVDDIYSRGQQYRLENKIFQTLLPQGIVLDYNVDKGFKKFKGALVQEPLIALLTNVACIDFASLYPSIMICYNISHDTFVGTNIAKPPKGLKWEDLHEIEINESVKHYFVKKEIKLGTMPALLKDFLESRAAKKKLLKVETDPVLRANLDGEQNALKIIANSGYGFLGASEGKLPLPQGAESVTAMGRMLITLVADELIKIGAIIVYGDSVVKDTPILTRRNGVIAIKTIETLGKNWKDYDEFKPWIDGNKEQDDNVYYEVWSDEGWVKIKRVIRHYTDKKIYEILTHTGMVRVTKDHSLLRPNGDEITPNQCTIGTELMHSFPEIENAEEGVVGKLKSYIYGFFLGDGSCGKYGSGSSLKYTWALNNKDMELNEKLKEMLEAIYQCDFKILDTLESSGVYKIVPSCGDIKSFVKEYRPIFYDQDKNKIIPPVILNGTFEEKESFMEGYFAADGCRKDLTTGGCHRFDIKSQISAMNMYYLVKSLGFKASINKREDKPEIFRITYTTKNQRKSPIKIKKIREIGECNDYVYDLETENGHFHAGVGEIIVHNTDSIFFTFDRWKDLDGPDNAKLMMKETEVIAKNITNFLNRVPIEIVLDHFYSDYLCVRKKCDIKNEVVVEKDGTVKLKTSFKGVMFVRREQCKKNKTVYKDCSLTAIGRTTWGEKDSLKVRELRAYNILWNDYKEELITETIPRSKIFPEEGETTITRIISINKKNESETKCRIGGMLEMMSRSVPLDDLAKITQAGREPKEYALESQPIRRFMEREERMGRPVKVGERFRWWLVRPPAEFIRNKEKILRGDWMRRALEENEKIDTFYYIDSLKSPIKTLFKATFGDDSFFDKCIALVKLKATNMEEIERRPWPVKLIRKSKTKKINRIK